METLILEGSETIDIRDPVQVAARLKCALSAKQYGFEDFLAPLIAEACISVAPKNPINFDVDNVRTVKIPGAVLGSSTVVKGMVVRRGVEGSISHKENTKVAVYTQVRFDALSVSALFQFCALSVSRSFGKN